jgi:chromosome condensin MukBEF complex kleisin-like MukF subunit
VEKLLSGPGIDGSFFNRDPFNFWYPLDARFVDNIMNLADAANMEFVSFFWTRYFFAYLDYSTETRSLSVTEMNRHINQAANANVKEGILGLLGQHYQQRLSNRTTYD